MVHLTLKSTNEARFLCLQRLGAARGNLAPVFSTRTGFFSTLARHFSVLIAAAQNFIVSSVENAATFVCERSSLPATAAFYAFLND